MKTSFLVICLFAFGFSFGQTKIIAHKSHSGDGTSIASEKDGNFGLPPERLDSVIKISDSCIVEINNFGWRDTVYNHPYFIKSGASRSELESRYPNVKFVGFDKPKSGKKHPEKKGSLYLLAFLMAGTLFYTFKSSRKSAV